MNILDAFNDQQAQNSFSGGDVQTYKVQAVLPYILPILFFLPIISEKNSAFCKFHANQQLAWLIVSAVLGLVGKIIGFIPILGAIVGGVIGLAWLLLSILLMISANQGKAIRIPVIGSMFEIF